MDCFVDDVVLFVECEILMRRSHFWKTLFQVNEPKDPYICMAPSLAIA